LLSLGADSGRDTVDLTPYLKARQEKAAKVPWKIGEYFQFSIDWSGVNGGSALMQVQNMQTVDGHRTWRIVTKAESNSFVSKFYKVRDRAESFIDADSLYTRRFEKHLREGSYKKDISVRYDQEARKAIYESGSQVDVPARVHDVLSAFYYVRTCPLPEGGMVSIPTHDNEKSYEMLVKVIGIATPRFARFGAIAVPAATVNRVVDALLKSGHIPHGYLGVGLHPIRLPDALRQTIQREEKTAAMVVEVAPDGPAHKAGIMIGDLLLSFGSQSISRVEDVHAQLAADAIGKTVAVQLLRGGVAQEAKIVIAERARGGE
jgi:hypothetical protein